MANIRDVAKHAGVAACTVSRVLNGSGYVSEDTKQRIEQAMKELDYIPNELARSMFRQRAGIIAMLVPNIRHPYFSSLADAIEKELFRIGFKLMLCSTNDDPQREKEYLDTLRSNLVDGLIMGVSQLTDEAYAQMKKPMVMLDYCVNAEIPVVVSNHLMGGKLAAMALIESGCSHVLHLRGVDHKGVISSQSHEELTRSLMKGKIHVIERQVQWNEFDYDGYFSLAREMLQEMPEVNGFMGADLAASAFIKAALELGRRIPEDFAVVAYDGTYAIKMNNIEVTTIKQDLGAIARNTVQTINRLIKGEMVGEPLTLIDVKLIQGKTTKL